MALKFEVPVQSVLDGAAEADLVMVAIVGRDANGDLYVASSTEHWQTIAMFQAAPDEIERLSSEEDDED